MTVRIGFGLVTCQVPPWADHDLTDEYADALASAALVELLGYDSIWVSEHHLAEDGYLPSAAVLLAAMAAGTRRVKLGMGVALAPLQHPIRFAEDCAVADRISAGRLIVGLGVGWRAAEFDAFGVALSERAHRTRRLVEICRQAWGPGSGTDGGDSPREPNFAAAITPKPASMIPLLLGGTARPAIERAGRLADGYIGSPQNDLAAFRAAVDVFDSAATRAGRDPTSMPLALHVNAWVSADGSIPDPVLRAMWHQIGTYAVWHAQDDGSSESELPPLDMARLQRRTVHGTPAQFVEQCRPWIEAFPDRELHLIFRLHYPGMRLADAEPAIRLFATEVAPALRLSTADRSSADPATAPQRVPVATDS